MEQVINQAPSNISNEEIERIYLKNDKDQTKTLMELWEIKTELKEETEDKKKWDGIRDICDSFDNEMANYFKKK